LKYYEKPAAVKDCGGLSSYSVSSESAARAAADGRVVEADVAAATRLAALGEAVAAGLEHLAALLVARGAGDAAAVFGDLADAVAASQVALRDAQAVLTATQRAQALREHAAEVLQRAAGNFILTLAVNLEATGALLELDRAARRHLPFTLSRRRRDDSRRTPTHCGGGLRGDGAGFHQSSCRHKEIPFNSRAGALASIVGRNATQFAKTPAWVTRPLVVQ
jgi:hypothetical protein